MKAKTSHNSKNKLTKKIIEYLLRNYKVLFYLCIVIEDALKRRRDT